jgi:predicted dehydrogenase
VRGRQIHVGLIGLGTIAETHAAVLSERADVTLSFVVDVDPRRALSFRDTAPPSYRAVEAALADHQPDLVVITTPTKTHADLTCRVLERSTARVLVEKPLVHDLDALTALQALDPRLDLRTRVHVAHHFAFSPEVEWAAAEIERHPEWGPITGLTSAFHDPYIVDAEHAFAAHASSWIDSGTNQLSMLTRLVDLVGTHELHETAGGASAWRNVDFRSRGTIGRALLRTSWQAAASSKRTTLVLGDSGVEVWLDHTAVTAFATHHGRLVASLVNDGLTPRKTAHYRPLYESLLSEAPDPVLGFETAVQVVRLLHATSSS